MADAELITTPAGSTIESEIGGGYRVCDRDHHCLRAESLWQAQEMVHWAELHHRPLIDPPRGSDEVTAATAASI
jgi:hypothetical protein